MRAADVMNNRLLYTAWQAPFVREKFAPVVAHNDLANVRSVLDIGCGPGTNARRFTHCEYTGVDMNPSYIDYARRRFKRRFVVADVTKYEFGQEKFDFVFANSLMHHLETEDTRSLLRRMAELVASDGHVHIIDLILPEEACLARTLTKADRGLYPRPIEQWRELFSEFMQPVVFEPFVLRRIGITLWHLIYFKGRAKA